VVASVLVVHNRTMVVLDKYSGWYRLDCSYLKNMAGYNYHRFGVGCIEAWMNHLDRHNSRRPAVVNRS
jgi:hypothetical protein